MIKIASQKFPHLNFHAGEIADLSTSEKFDYIVLSGLLGELDDIQTFFAQLKKYCYQRTRIIIEYYSYFWQYLLKIGENLHLKMPQKLQNWITYHDVANFLALTGYEPIKLERSILFPKNILGFSYVVNKFIAKLPVFNALTLNHFVAARPLIDYDKEFAV